MFKKLFQNKKLLIIILSAIVLIGIAVAIILICIKDKDDKTDPCQTKLDEFYQVIANPEDAEFLYDGLTAVYNAALEFGDEAMDKIGYVRNDVNDDGKEEIFIGCFDAEDTGEVKNEIYAAFTYDGETMEPLFEKQKRNTFALTDAGTIYFYGTDDAKYYILAEYALDETGKLICKDFYFTYPKDGDGNDFRYYHNTTGVWDPEGSEEIQMTPEELEAKRQALAGKTALLDAEKFSQIGK